MKPIAILLGYFFCGLLGYQLGYSKGYKAHQDTLPSCLYILRPRGNNVKPWGIDNKEGIDWYADNIAGGGLYINLAQWKRN